MSFDQVVARALTVPPKERPAAKDRALAALGRVSGAEAAVYNALLAAFRWDRGFAPIGKSKLGAQTKLARRSVIRALNALEKQCLIAARRHPDCRQNRRATDYTLPGLIISGLVTEKCGEGDLSVTRASEFPVARLVTKMSPPSLGSSSIEKVTPLPPEGASDRSELHSKKGRTRSRASRLDAAVAEVGSRPLTSGERALLDLLSGLSAGNQDIDAWLRTWVRAIAAANMDEITLGYVTTSLTSAMADEDKPLVFRPPAPVLETVLRSIQKYSDRVREAQAKIEQIDDWLSELSARDQERADVQSNLPVSYDALSSEIHEVYRTRISGRSHPPLPQHFVQNDLRIDVARDPGFPEDWCSAARLAAFRHGREIAEGIQRIHDLTTNRPDGKQLRHDREMMTKQVEAFSAPPSWPRPPAPKPAYMRRYG